MKIKRIEHVAIAVRNLDAVRDTLATLGISCDHEETLPEHRIRLAMLPIGESALELLEPQDETGATAVEYGIMVALIAAVIIAVVTTMGTNMSSMFANVAGKL